VTFKEIKSLTGCYLQGVWAVLTVNPYRLDDAFIQAGKIHDGIKARETSI
jgi:hypothetical protein